MNITSEDEALIELYTNGKTSDKRYRSLPPQVIKGFKKAVDYMKAAQRIEDLFPLKGLNYEALKGKRRGTRISTLQWCLAVDIQTFSH